jgi:hypothetical protein
MRLISFSASSGRLFGAPIMSKKNGSLPPGEEAVLSGRGYCAQGTTDAIVQSSKGSSIDQLSNLPASQ